MPEQNNGDLQVELYKHLRQEASSYMEKVPAIWLQKFVLIGAVIAFTLTSNDTSNKYNSLITLGLVAVPLLALF